MGIGVGLIGSSAGIQHQQQQHRGELGYSYPANDDRDRDKSDGYDQYHQPHLLQTHHHHHQQKKQQQQHPHHNANTLHSTPKHSLNADPTANGGMPRYAFDAPGSDAGAGDAGVVTNIPDQSYTRSTVVNRPPSQSFIASTQGHIIIGNSTSASASSSPGVPSGTAHHNGLLPSQQQTLHSTQPPTTTTTSAANNNSVPAHCNVASTLKESVPAAVIPTRLFKHDRSSSHPC